MAERGIAPQLNQIRLHLEERWRRRRPPGRAARNELDLTLAGGDKAMTRMPFYDFGARSGYKLGNRSLVDGTVMMLTDPFHDIHMGVTAENVASKYGISGGEQDEFAVESQRRAATAEARAPFAEEIVPVEVGGGKPLWPIRTSTPSHRTMLETLANADGRRPSPPGQRSRSHADALLAQQGMAQEPERGGRRCTGLVLGHLNETGLQSPVHGTKSVDYGIVLEGEITLVLDD